MVGLTENPDALRKWMVVAPELTTMVNKFECDVLNHSDEDTDKHHRETSSVSKKFSQDVQNLVRTMNEFGNPFLEGSQDVYNICSKNVAREVVNTVRNIEKAGKRQYQEFVNERLCDGTKHLKDPIKMNKFPLMSTTAPQLNKSKAKLTAMKSDCSLFSKLYIATSEHRCGDLDSFFSHENQQYLPSISEYGELREGKKSDLVDSLLAFCPESGSQTVPSVNAKILDGSVVVHMLSRGQCKTFQDYIEYVFHPFVRNELATVKRLDIVWDVYKATSLKNGARKHRGCGIRTRVTLTTKIPKSWPNFLRESENKEELFRLLASSIPSIKEEGKELYTTMGASALTSTGRDTEGRLHPCDHEEADTRIMLHISDAVAEGLIKVLVRTVDTDVLILAINCVQKIKGLEELWVQLGTW